MIPSPELLQHILEAALLVAGRPLTPAQLQKLFDANEMPDIPTIRSTLQAIAERFANSGIQLCEIASGWQLQSRPDLGERLSRLWEERSPRYSRALLETLALIAWRQPITRAEIEDIRGVTVSSHITRTLMEREWIRIIGYRDIPGKPALYGTTKSFLDYFNLKSLNDLPALVDTQDLEQQAARLQAQLELTPSPTSEAETAEEIATAAEETETAEESENCSEE